jgi:hypothetical protein
MPEFHKPHEEPEYPYPTVQCGCRMNGFPSNYKLEEGLPQIAAALKGAYQGCEILEATPDYIISGHRAFFIKMKFRMNNLDGNPIDCLGRTFRGKRGGVSAASK